ncbi:MAG: hypothetical protein F4Z82_04505 [Caldilineaceae bacterium SB0668_bin_21]|nr:hypothetical protein [Caldilineaceae bacterium SB0668_bin_21]MYC19963.1 hypothetical protein [Caldilineaceae bacterium SB0662_bin_25]
MGGTTLVYEGLRQQTLDIDISFEVDDRDHGAFIEAVRDLKERLALNIEEASPADFIPLPSGYRERSPFIGRYGQLEVFHFDLYSTALSKIERGTEGDLDDVLSLLRNGRMEFADLAGCFEEIMVRYATESIKQDPAEYRRKFDILTDMWLTGSSPG